MNISYSCNTNKLHPDLQKVFFEWKEDQESLKFLKKTNISSLIQEIWYFFLRLSGKSHYGAVWNLQYDTFLLQKTFIKTILSQDKNIQNMLDIGAWSGTITKCFQSFIRDIYFIEPSSSFTKKLLKKWFKPHSEQSKKHYDLVVLLNVLDICKNPEKICKKAISLMENDGKILISLPLPINLRRDGRRIVGKSLQQNRDITFEAAASEFYQNFLHPLNLQVILFSKMPYMVLTGEYKNMFVYTNGVFVCEKK